MNATQILVILKKNKAELKRRFNVLNIGLFGSFVKELNNEDSDIDLVFELQKGTTMGLKEISDLELYFNKLFGNHKVDLVNDEYLNPIIREDIKDSIVYV